MRHVLVIKTKQQRGYLANFGTAWLKDAEFQVRQAFVTLQIFAASNS
jgi:hypothetical protein